MSVRRSVAKPVVPSEEEEVAVAKDVQTAKEVSQSGTVQVRLVASDSFTMLLKIVEENRFVIVPYDTFFNTYEIVNAPSEKLANAKAPFNWLEQLAVFTLTPDQLQEALYQLGYYQDNTFNVKQILRDLALRGQFPIISQ